MGQFSLSLHAVAESFAQSEMFCATRQAAPADQMRRLSAVLSLLVVVHNAEAQVGVMTDSVPFAYDQDVEMKVNGDSMSGIAEQYVSVSSATCLSLALLIRTYLCLKLSGQGRLTIRTRSLVGLRFEALTHPTYGIIGWNNSVSGEFVYSPRDYTMETTNHGVESLSPVPGCEKDCSTCPDKTVATQQQIDSVEDPDFGFPCVTHWAAVDQDSFQFRGAISSAFS